ncbi:MAG TPA: DUF4382 domain-containing protein [Puia sp.]|jgi:hypothetical protein|nr:DUF4382 domain-containing protein [Puia sp.]
MKTVTKWLAFGASAAASFVFFACNKNNSSNSNPNIPPGKSQVSIYMMDDPIQYSKVLIDIRQVAVLVDTGAKQTDSDHDDQWDDNYCGWHRTQENRSVFWDTLDITPGVYDLLQLRNGVDTLLASGLIPSGKILKVKITLGSDNTVYTDSATHYPLEVFGPHPYFTINVRRVDVSAAGSNDFKLWLDFNLERSIFFWNGEFLLKPYIVVFNDQVQAKLKGEALPRRKVALVTAYSSSDTLYAIPDWSDGDYMIRNVPAGTYSINFKGRDGYKDTTITNISVTTGQTSKVPAVTLHQ